MHEYSSNDKTLLHLTAVCNAVQFLDDLIKLAGDQDISPTLIQSQQLPPLEVKYSLGDLKKHFQRLSKEQPADDPARVTIQPLPTYNRVMGIVKGLLGVRQRVEWLVVRVDEKIHQAERYYEIIPFSSSFSQVAIRLYANYCTNTDLAPPGERAGQPRDLGALFCERLARARYGGLWTEPIVVMKGESFTASAQARDVHRMGRIGYQAMEEKPQPYASVEECALDLLQIGVNCTVYNQDIAQLVELAQGLIRDVLLAFRRELRFQPAEYGPGTFTLDRCQQIVDAQSEWKARLQ